jgi:hypothetical protein
MSEKPDNDRACATSKRLEPFLDCVAYLLAKRWLREQRQGATQPPQGESLPGNERDSP